MTVCTNTIPEGAVLTCSHMNILRALQKDDLDTLVSELAAFDDVSFTMIISGGDDIPWMLKDAPPMPCVCAFFAAKDCFKYLMTLNFDLRICDAKCRNLGHFAVAGGSMEILRELDARDTVDSKKGGSIFAQGDEKMNQCAHYAAKFGRLDVLQWLWMKGKAELNPRNNNGGTPFMWSCSNGQVDVAKFLHDHGAKTNEKTYFGRWSPLHYAAAQNQVATAEYLLNCDDIEIDLMRAHDGPTPLMTAIENGALDVVKLLVEHGCSFELGLTKGDRWCPIHPHPVVYAARAGETEILKYLLSVDSVWETLNSSHVKKIIDEAVATDAELLETIIARATQFGKCSKSMSITGQLPVLIRKGCTGEEFSKLFALEDAPLEFTRVNDGFTYLHMAAECDNDEVARFLVGHGAGVNQKSYDGETPLAVAIRKNSTDVAEFLASLPELDTTMLFKKTKRSYLDLCCPRSSPKESMKNVAEILLNRQNP